MSDGDRPVAPTAPGRPAARPQADVLAAILHGLATLDDPGRTAVDAVSPAAPHPAAHLRLPFAAQVRRRAQLSRGRVAAAVGALGAVATGVVLVVG